VNMGPQLSDDAESAPGLTTKANGKAGAASPKLTEGESVELDDVDKDGDKLPLHEDIMQLARLGEIGPVQNLFENGKYDAKYKDQEGITPLHVSWVSAHTPLDNSSDWDPVGCNQQPLCVVQIPNRVRRGHQCKRGRVGRYAGYVGSTEMSSLRRPFTPPERRRSTPYRCARLQPTPPCNL